MLAIKVLKTLRIAGWPADAAHAQAATLVKSHVLAGYKLQQLKQGQAGISVSSSSGDAPPALVSAVLPLVSAPPSTAAQTPVPRTLLPPPPNAAVGAGAASAAPPPTLVPPPMGIPTTAAVPASGARMPPAEGAPQIDAPPHPPSAANAAANKTAPPAAGAAKAAPPAVGTTKTATPAAGTTKAAPPAAGTTKTASPAGMTTKIATPAAGTAKAAAAGAGGSKTASPAAGTIKTAPPAAGTTTKPAAGTAKAAAAGAGGSKAGGGSKAAAGGSKAGGSSSDWRCSPLQREADAHSMQVLMEQLRLGKPTEEAARIAQEAGAKYVAEGIVQQPPSPGHKGPLPMIQVEDFIGPPEGDIEKW